MPTKLEQHNFSLEVEKAAVTHRISHLEAVLHLCETTGLEIEVAARLISHGLKEKLASDAETMNLMKTKRSTTKLPF